MVRKVLGCAARVVPGALKRGLGRSPEGPRHVLKDVCNLRPRHVPVMSFRTRPEGAEPGL